MSLQCEHNWKLNPGLVIFIIHELENYTTVQARWESEILGKEQGALFQQCKIFRWDKTKMYVKIYFLCERNA